MIQNSDERTIISNHGNPRSLLNLSPEDYVLATGQSYSVGDLVDYVFDKLELDKDKYLKTDKKFERAEELHYLRGDASKAVIKLGWKREYTFETMLDEMIEHWLLELKK